MNRILRAILVLAFITAGLILAWYILYPSSSCPLEGSARNYDLQQLNRLKNRTNLPFADDMDTNITFETILSPGYDRNRFSSAKAVEITAFVYRVKSGEKETCNCESDDPDNWDTHIELVEDEHHIKGPNRIIVEVIPLVRRMMKAQGKDWSTETLKNTLTGRWVKIRGWLLFDFEHERQSENTNPGGKRNWRATAWEIHPVTAIEVIEKPTYGVE
jgi:hypothetical protein